MASRFPCKLNKHRSTCILESRDILKNNTHKFNKRWWSDQKKMKTSKETKSNKEEHPHARSCSRCVFYTTKVCYLAALFNHWRVQLLSKVNLEISNWFRSVWAIASFHVNAIIISDKRTLILCRYNSWSTARTDRLDGSFLENKYTAVLYCSLSNCSVLAKILVYVTEDHKPWI